MSGVLKGAPLVGPCSLLLSLYPVSSFESRGRCQFTITMVVGSRFLSCTLAPMSSKNKGFTFLSLPLFPTATLLRILCLRHLV
jgi:hypothetical protein